MPAESTLGGIAELLEEDAEFSSQRLSAGDYIERRRAAASSLRALEEVLATMPKEPEQTPNPATQQLREMGYDMNCGEFVRRLRTALTAPTTGGQE